MIQNDFETVLNRYVSARTNEGFAGNYLRTVFESIKSSLAASQPIQARPSLKLFWGIGQGKWANVPWIAMLDKKMTTTT